MITIKAHKEKIQIWLKYRAYIGNISMEMRFGADAECFVEIWFSRGIWLLNLLKQGVTDLTGNNMLRRKEEKILDLEVQIQGGYSGSYSSGLQNLLLVSFGQKLVSQDLNFFIFKVRHLN